MEEELEPQAETYTPAQVMRALPYLSRVAGLELMTIIQRQTIEDLRKVDNHAVSS